MKVGEVATRAGVSVRSIRYYEQAGLLQATRRDNGYREFDPTAIDRVAAIRDLLETGFTVQEILSLSACLHEGPQTIRCCEQTATIYREKLVRIAAQMQTLRTVQRRIEERIADLEPC
jgi:DNA-binding transcriptional MerR regulator